MGHRLHDEVLDHAPASLTHREAWVLGVLARDANDETRLTFSPIEAPVILHRARVSRPQMYAVLKALIEKGTLERATAGQKNARAKYRIRELGPQRPQFPDAEPGQRPQTPNTDPAPAPPPTAPSAPAPKRTPAPDPEGFDEFWAAYPRRVSKGSARTAWAKAIKRGAQAADITAAAARAAAQWRQQNTDPKFIPHPATWLNNERYDDEPEASPPQPTLPGTGRYSDPAERGIF